MKDDSKKLTYEEAVKIRDRYDNGKGESQGTLAKSFNVTQTVISNIVNFKIWKNGTSISHKASINKPDEEKQTIFQHGKDEEITMVDVGVNGLIDLLASKYEQKWGSSIELRYRDFKITDIKEFMDNNKISVDDMKNYITWLFSGRLTNKFKGNLGCLHSQSMYNEWKGKEILSTGTSEDKFKKIAQESITEYERNFSKYITPAEREEWEEAFSLDRDPNDTSINPMEINRRIQKACNERALRENK